MMMEPIYGKMLNMRDAEVAVGDIGKYMVVV